MAANSSRRFDMDLLPGTLTSRNSNTSSIASVTADAAVAADAVAAFACSDGVVVLADDEDDGNDASVNSERMCR